MLKIILWLEKQYVQYTTKSFKKIQIYKYKAMLKILLWISSIPGTAWSCHFSLPAIPSLKHHGFGVLIVKEFYCHSLLPLGRRSQQQHSTWYFVWNDILLGLKIFLPYLLAALHSSFLCQQEPPESTHFGNIFRDHKEMYTPHRDACTIRSLSREKR